MIKQAIRELNDCFVDFKRIQQTLALPNPNLELISFYAAQSAVKVARAVDKLNNENL